MKLAFAVGTEGQFSLDGGLPWGEPIKEDMKHYVEFTKNCVMLMGYKTWMSLPAKTKDKYKQNGCIVLFTKENDTSRNFSECSSLVLNQRGVNLSFFASSKHKYEQDYCLIGGKGLIEEALENIHLFDEVLYTVVNKDFKDADYTYISTGHTNQLNKMVADQVFEYYNTDYDITVFNFVRVSDSNEW